MIMRDNNNKKITNVQQFGRLRVRDFHQLLFWDELKEIIIQQSSHIVVADSILLPYLI